MNRLCIYPADVAEILNKSISSARSLIRAIKDVKGKKSHQVVTIGEFCEYMDLPYEDVFEMLNSKGRRNVS